MTTTEVDFDLVEKKPTSKIKMEGRTCDTTRTLFYPKFVQSVSSFLKIELV